MQVQKISFTSTATQEQPQKEPALYSKAGYMNQVRTGQFMNGFLATYGLLEAVDKFQLIKNNKNLSAKALKQKAWKHTKYNILAGLAAGIASTLIGKFVTDKYTIPFAEKMWDYKLKQEEISKILKQPSENYKENTQDKTEQPKTELKEETPKVKDQTDKKPETESKEKTEEK